MIEPVIREVWGENLREEMGRISDLLERYNYVAMDAEFPGVVARPIGEKAQPSDYKYQTVRVNADVLKLIQLGISLADADGKSPPGCFCWQFNFRFNLSEDIYSQDSVELLTKAGINFAEHEQRGIDIFDFGEQIMSSGLVLNPEAVWVSFQSSYAFAYMLRLLTCLPLPSSEEAFLDMLEIFFPTIIDTKHLVQQSEELHGGLNRIAEAYSVQRVGRTHQAGSDSLLALHVFFTIRQQLFSRQIPRAMQNVLHGLGPLINQEKANTTNSGISNGGS
eukprot:Plantae.Rhodophyta-Hildenbrandia_rubra.ctg1079.p1 GENE.Plantae.Rhodophyta-Hildenbrandia_rubra.ctg1079~~Plantae.Rhodophyta-Hildenbrandia_rubra.ctg1079.p1  ORF type:complete len:277 (+),score=26.12 Plantae.Rhodophyta-Hildenbrandia_rubra.ctg1079:156-986(+)